MGNSLSAVKCHHGVIATLLLLAAAAFGQVPGEARDAAQWRTWQSGHDTRAFEQYLRAQGAGDVAPLYQLLRSASDWQRCGAEPFAVPPEALWPAVKRTLMLLKALQAAEVVGHFEVVSAYRDARLNRCAGGSAHSAHTRAYAVDLWLEQPAPGLCDFWKARGQPWQMGLSRYPSGRIHIDTAGYRTWGEDYSRASAWCR
ncbi:D-Ala-D-Ala carboxypeptidase family metallohydrolase [Pseudomonas typographi]|uniref:D-Ala-D-Ala carboxypeptidase family metallohydrolase n=1 Tax=Pseudomonas typographi TaxID=2715964 RepID=UPI001685DA96|nr:D-Ala-D-Ala carboxypeptidase family metallohydrolase [Pseudomonas typographi]MBD1554482.1 peptidase M15 [Pseudomonas typographi]MBD1590142.1 peptidase M15 [Pseudomonas typographi]